MRKILFKNANTNKIDNFYLSEVNCKNGVFFLITKIIFEARFSKINLIILATIFTKLIAFLNLFICLEIR